MRWRDVRKNGYCFSLLTLVLFGLCSIRHLRAEEEIIKSGNCVDFYESSPTEKSNAPAWALDNQLKTCYVCNQENTKQSWFVSKLFKTNNAELVHVNVTMSFSTCPQCFGHSLKVLVIHKAIAKNMDDKKVIEELNRLPLSKEIQNKTKPGIKKTYYVQFLPTSKVFSIVLLAEGACLVVNKFKLSYSFCEKASIKGVTLPRTVSPASGIRTVNSSCFNNTIPPHGGSVFGLCSSDGKWKSVTPCLCKKGFTFGSKGCVSCRRDTYKAKVGNYLCLPCPSNSESVPQAIMCKCKRHFYRLPGNNDTDICHGIPSKVQNVKFHQKTDSLVVIQWFPPARKINTVSYDIECFKCRGEVCEDHCGNKPTYKPSKSNLTWTNVTVGNLEANTQYMFVVYSRNNNSVLTNQSNWLSVRIKVETEGVSMSSSGMSTILTIIVPIVVVVILVIIIIVLSVILVKRRKFKRRATLVKRGHVDLPLIGEKNYIDPTTYDDPERAVSEFAKELDRDLIKFECILGGGEFGDVYKGTLKRPGEPVSKIAIKTLKAGSTSKNRKDFLIEASVMGQFKNLNVVTLEGVVTKTIPLLIVTEFMENGSLDDYLKSNDGLLKPLQLLGMARGVASGMAYLAGMHFVHRDLAARNVLVNVNLACKVADFGLSRDIGDSKDSEYETQGGRIPVRWTAPEAIRYRKFSTASDVWSYGILLWEIMAFAERPYWDWGNLEVLERVDGGYRLPPPMNCPKIVHQLMMECWEGDRTKRPGFPDILKIVDEWIRSPEKLKEETFKMRRREPLDITTFNSVKDWLDAFKMGMYASNFAKAGYRTLDEVTKLSEAELLSKVEVRLVGHRHKIYQRIKEMNEHLQIVRNQKSMRI